MAVILFMKSEGMENRGFASVQNGEAKGSNQFYLHTILYFVLFVVSLLTVAHILPYQLVVFVVIAVVLLTDRKMIGKVDYSLLFTFVAFFI